MIKQTTMGDMQFNGTPEEWDALVKKNRQKTTKLYTEQQVREILKSTHIHTDNDVDMILPQFTPIELPTDEEIETKIENMEGISLEIEVGYRAGARWMRDKILNK